MPTPPCVENSMMSAGPCKIKKVVENFPFGLRREFSLIYDEKHGGKNMSQLHSERKLVNQI